MSGNNFKEPTEDNVEDTVETAAPAKKGGNRVARFLSSVLDGSFLKRENAASQITFLLFLTLVAIVYIGNAYYAEKGVRESSRLNNDLKQMQGQFINAQSKLSEKTRQSKMAEKAANMGLHEAIIPPAKLVTHKEKK